MSEYHKTTVTVPVTQYVRLNGKRVEVIAEVDGSLSTKVSAILAAGLRFTAEKMDEDHVALCIENDEEDLAIEIAPNKPGIVQEFEKLIRDFKLARPRPRAKSEAGDGQ
ncbi:MAG TPA: hypothetical protein VNH19_17635 [Candidatus Limnocylindrales bacterium]|nr:hypothetical protein [Candidatus Limnocylindrales bacterium]